MKKVLAFFKRFWKIILVIVGVLVLIFFGKQVAEYRRKKEREKLKRDLEMLKSKKELKQEQLERELEKLKKEAEEREKVDKFNNVDDALDFLNDVLRRIQGDSKK
ncbi:MAG: hypothetical protein QXQ53_08770 [Candidatus Methanosuratincola sp.]